MKWYSTMISELSKIVDSFPGSPNQTRCFLHILNLVVKSILRQFDPPKAADGASVTIGADELAALSRDLEGGAADDEEEDDNEEGLVDERAEMTEEEIEELEASVEPVRLALTKVQF